MDAGFALTWICRKIASSRVQRRRRPSSLTQMLPSRYSSTISLRDRGRGSFVLLGLPLWPFFHRDFTGERA